jgi:hypothetical protein
VKGGPVSNETVIFLGAGASRAVGLPMTTDILPGILRGLQKQTLFGDDAPSRGALLACLTGILPGLEGLMDKPLDERRELPPVTDVISAIDHHLLTANTPLPDLKLSDLVRGRNLLERAIFEQLVRYDPSEPLALADVPESVLKEWGGAHAAELFPARSDQHRQQLRRTIDWILDLARAGRVTIISMNYDIEVEQQIYEALGYEGVFEQVDFGTSVREPNTGRIHDRPRDARFGVYKLHGSLNWLRCDVCDTVYVNPMGPIAYLSFLLDREPDEADPFRRMLWETGANQCHCGHRPLRHVIVAPSFVREMRDVILVEVWRNALAVLRRATTWFIVGYSLPPEDVAVRSILLRGRAARSPLPAPRIVVIQKQKKEPELTRYGLLFPGNDYIAGGLENYVATAH